MATAAMIRNELQKTWRSRWLVFAVFFGLLILISAGLYAFYVYREHRWAPPPPTPWQATLQNQIASDKLQLQNLQNLKQQAGAGARVGGGGAFGRAQAESIDSAIKATQQAINDDQYLLDNNIAPVQANTLAFAALFALGSIIMFLLTRIFGWLSSELVAGERSDRTIAILLSRPASRDQVLVSKTVSMFLVALGVVLLTLLVAYGVFAFFLGSAGPLDGQIGIAIDGSRALGPGNLTVVPAVVFALMCLGAAMLAILAVEGMSLLVSVLTTRWAAIGITLAVLFAGPVVSGIVGLVLTLITGSSGSSDFLNYIFFNLLNPVGAVAPAFGNGPSAAGEGMTVFTHQIAALAGWTVAFFAAAWFLFHRRQETG
jgi:ABC-2 type transport system permease protein